MARSASDATRFTATGPYAHSKPGTRASTFAFADPPPPNETPQQKVARLREAARRAKLGQISTFDKVVTRGRVWADAAHRFTAITLITAAEADAGTNLGVAGLVTLFSLGDMIVYNRRKRREFYAEAAKKHEEELALARIALGRGTADENQMLLLNRERAVEESLQAKKGKGFFKETLGFIYGKPEDEEAKKQKTTAEGGETSKEITKRKAQEAREGLEILKAVEESRRDVKPAQSSIQASTTAGGPLDRIADEATTSASKNAKSWTSWVTGR
ncbi:hypothetical protein K432DRAFT_322477, partial [Lepidopterella palustris CBS 459.81]